MADLNKELKHNLQRTCATYCDLFSSTILCKLMHGDIHAWAMQQDDSVRHERIKEQQWLAERYINELLNEFDK